MIVNVAISAAIVASLVVIVQAIRLRRRWDQKMVDLEAQVLNTKQTTSFCGLHDNVSRKNLPPLVQRYLQHVLGDNAQKDKPVVSHVRFHQEGYFRMSSGKWVPFQALQVMSCDASRPGFVWKAEMSMPLGMKVHVCDAWANGSGFLLASLLKIVNLIPAPSPDSESLLILGEALRWLAEAPLQPNVFLSDLLQWEETEDKNTFKLKMEEPNTKQNLELTISFQDDLWIHRIECMRPCAKGQDIFEMKHWFGVMSKYKKSSYGVWIPTRMECGWLEGEEEQLYFQANVEELDYLSLVQHH